MGRGADLNKLRLEMVAVSREWSLLSPHTAFLVLENEAQYRQYQIDRTQRRRYWKPADAVAASPLPENWLKLVTSEMEKETKKAEAERFAQAIRTSQAALDTGDAKRQWTC